MMLFQQIRDKTFDLKYTRVRGLLKDDELMVFDQWFYDCVYDCLEIIRGSTDLRYDYENIETTEDVKVWIDRPNAFKMMVRDLLLEDYDTLDDALEMIQIDVIRRVFEATISAIVRSIEPVEWDQDIISLDHILGNLISDHP